MTEKVKALWEKYGVAGFSLLGLMFVGFLGWLGVETYSNNARIAKIEAKIEALDATMNARFEAQGAAMNARFEVQEARLDGLEALMNARFDELEAVMNARFDEQEALMNARFDALDAKLDRVLAGVQSNSAAIADLDARVDDLAAGQAALRAHVGLPEVAPAVQAPAP